MLYNDVPNEDATTSQWAMVEVISIIEDPFDPTFFALVELDYATHAAYSFHAGTVANAAPVAAGGFGGTPKLTRISVVRYFTQLHDPAAYSGPPPQLVMRSVDFAPAQPVGYLENFQIAYTIGIAAPVDQDDPPDPIQDLGAGVVLTAENMLSGVRITVTARSISAGLEGASEGADAGRADDWGSFLCVIRTFRNTTRSRAHRHTSSRWHPCRETCRTEASSSCPPRFFE